jgi:two-component system, LytTR family, sensor kinase
MSGESLRARARTALAIVAVATAFGLFETLKTFVAIRARGDEAWWPELLVVNMPWWYGWALLTPLAVLVPRRWPIDVAARRVRRAAAHALAAVVLASVHLWIVGAVFYVSTPRRAPIRARYGINTFTRFERNWHENFLVANVITCATIMGSFYALSYYRRYRETELARARLEHGMAEARLQALRMELNPHFLYNTLNAISGLVRKNENAAAVTVIARLADLLRATLDRGAGPETPLGEELALLEGYLEIERARFGSRLAARVDAPPSLADALVPSFLLQPLVENAVRHGVARHPGPGAVTVRAFADDGRLRLEVRDTGPGFPAEGLGEGVGLTNTRARLAQLYGDDARLELSNDPAGGAVARVEMPLRRG